MRSQTAMNMLFFQIGVFLTLALSYAFFNNKPDKTVIVREEASPIHASISLLYETATIRDIGGSSGTGIIVTKDIVLTCHHVINSVGFGNTVWVDWRDEQGEHTNSGKVVAIDTARDLAAIMLTDHATFTHSATISTTNHSWGTPLIAVGCPSGHYPAPCPGMFVLQAETSGFDMIQASAFPGHSGGPVFDATNGEVIGLISRLYAPVQIAQNVHMIATHVFLSIPDKWILDFLRENGIKLK